MAIFPYIESELIVQIDDKTRISGAKSYGSKDEADISLVEIEPESGNGFIDVTGSSLKNWYLDWEYATNGIKQISLRVTTDGAPVVKLLSISALSVADDNLFSDDNDLRQIESDVLKYVEDGRNSFKNMHRQAQTQMMDYLYRAGITDISGDKLTPASVTDINEMRDWSKFLTLRLIWSDLSTNPLDFFAAKATEVLVDEQDARNKAILKLDRNGDGDNDDEGAIDLSSRRLVRF